MTLKTFVNKEYRFCAALSTNYSEFIFSHYITLLVKIPLFLVQVGFFINMKHSKDYLILKPLLVYLWNESING